MFIVIEEHKDGFNVLHSKDSYFSNPYADWGLRGLKELSTTTTKTPIDAFESLDDAKRAVEKKATRETYGITFHILDLDAGKVVSQVSLTPPPLPWKDVK